MDCWIKENANGNRVAWYIMGSVTIYLFFKIKNVL